MAPVGRLKTRTMLVFTNSQEELYVSKYDLKQKTSGKRPDQRRRLYRHVLCHCICGGPAWVHTNLYAAALRAGADRRRNPVHAVFDQSEKVRNDLDHERHYGDFDAADRYGLLFYFGRCGFRPDRRADLQKRRLQERLQGGADLRCVQHLGLGEFYPAVFEYRCILLYPPRVWPGVYRCLDQTDSPLDVPGFADRCIHQRTDRWAAWKSRLEKAFSKGGDCVMPAFLLNSSTGKRALVLDPRTKLLLLVTMAVFVLGGLGGVQMENFRLALSVVPVFFLLFSMKWKAAFVFTFLFSVFYLMQIFLIPVTSGVVNFLVIAMTGIVTRFMPSIAMAYFVMSTTTVSEFVAAMERMHLSEKIVIPMSVIFRFFPTVGEEFTAINDAMRMRGVRFGGGKVTAMLEYRLIPMMICSVKIGEELSASALTRGLGAPVKRTNICRIGFRFPDVLALALCLLAFGMWILNSFFA